MAVVWIVGDREFLLFWRFLICRFVGFQGLNGGEVHNAGPERHWVLE